MFLPNIEIIIINRNLKKNSLKDKDVHVLNNLNINFFDPPTIELHTFFSKCVNIKISDAYFENRYETIYEIYDANSIHVYNDENFGNELKKHIFYYLSISQKFCQSFLDYYERCVIETINLD